MRKILSVAFAVALTLTTGAVFAEQEGMIEHTPSACIVGGEMPLMMVSVPTSDHGLLRSYFRRVSATDWCSVDGKNEGDHSLVTLPKFEVGDEIEYYFVVIDGKRIVAKSPQIYRAKATGHCDAPFNRHAIILTLECLPPGTNPIAQSLVAGFSARSIVNSGQPPVQSPEKPERGFRFIAP